MSYINTNFNLYTHFGLIGATEVLKNLTPSQFETLSQKVDSIVNSALEKGHAPNAEFIDEYIMNLRVWKHAPAKLWGYTWKCILWDNYNAEELMEWNGIQWIPCVNWRNPRIVERHKRHMQDVADEVIRDLNEEEPIDIMGI